VIALVVEEAREVLGHIPFSPVALGHGAGVVRALGRAPMPVAPAR